MPSCLPKQTLFFLSPSSTRSQKVIPQSNAQAAGQERGKQGAEEKQMKANENKKREETKLQHLYLLRFPSFKTQWSYQKDEAAAKQKSELQTNK